MDPSPKISVVGAGSMGVAWAIVFARAGLEVKVFDPVPDRLPDAQAEFKAIVRELEARGLVDNSSHSLESLVVWHDKIEIALADSSYCQECAPENESVKKEIFSRALKILPENAVIASSSSAIPISRVTSDLDGRERTLVVHPLNPPFLLDVVEVVCADYTSAETRNTARSLLAAAGMTPVVLNREIEGFLFNRLQGAILREAYCLVRDGIVDVADVDRAVSEGLGVRWSILGPFETVDLNTRGGIRKHAERLGPAYARMGAERGQQDEWTKDLVDKVDSQRRALLPLDQWQSRVSWRDRRLMDMKALRASASWRDET